MTPENDRGETGKALRGRQGPYRILAENCTDMISKHTLEGVFTYVSPACRSLLGNEPEDLVGRSAYELFHPEDLERIINTHSGILERPDVRTVSYRIRRKDNSYVWVETTAYVVGDPETGGEREIIAISRDAAVVRRIEGALVEGEEALRKSEEFYRFAVEAGRIGTWDLDLQTEKCLISPKMAELMGYPPHQTTVPASQWRASIIPADRGLMASALAASIESDAPFDLEFRIALRDGTERWLYSRGGATRDASGEALRVYGASIDVTERKRAEEALAREVRAKSDFLADVSHELRTPLTVIRGNAEVGLELGRGWAHADLLEEIVEASGMMSRMVEDLLFLARSDSDSLPVDLRTVPVARLLGRSAGRAEALAREHGASLGTVLGGEGSVRCDAHLIERAVLVLVENAAKYGPPGGRITLSSSTRGGELLIEVADQGSGIPPEELPHIFERYYRGMGSSEERGSGLGLAIVKTIVGAHGGVVEAQSTQGEGTRMRLRLPLPDDGS